MFELELRVDPRALAAAQAGTTERAYDLSEGVETHISAACDILADAQVANFHLICCGDKPWPVDVWVDFNIFLEQSLFLLKNFTEGESSFRLEFYEQGTESVLIFSRQGEYLRVRCESFWGGECSFGNQEEFITMELLVRSVADAVHEFIRCCERVCPHILDSQEMGQWREDIQRYTEQLLNKTR